MHRKSFLLIMKWCIIAIGINLFVPISAKGQCTKRNQCSKANATCVKQKDGTLYCPPLNHTNQTMDTRLGKIGEKSSSLDNTNEEDDQDTKKEAIKTMRVGVIALAIVIVVGTYGCLACCVGIAVLLYFLLTRVFMKDRERNET